MRSGVGSSTRRRKKKKGHRAKSNHVYKPFNLTFSLHHIKNKEKGLKKSAVGDRNKEKGINNTFLAF